MLPHTLKQNNPRSQYIRNIKEMEKTKNIEKWKTLGSEYLIKRPWLTARRDCVQLPSGVVLNEILCVGISCVDKHNSPHKKRRLCGDTSVSPRT